MIKNYGTNWNAELKAEEGVDYLDHAGDLRGAALGIDDKGVIWRCTVLSAHGGYCNPLNESIFGATNLGYPCYYLKEGEGPRVRILRNPKVVVYEQKE